MTMNDQTLSSIAGHTTVPTIWKAINKQYNAQTTMTAVVNVSMLFTTRGYVAQFNKTLDKIEQIYD